MDNEESTPLVLAIKNKRKDVFKYLLSLPYVNINRSSLKYGSPILLAIVTHEYKLVRRFVQSGENYRFIDLSVQCKDGNNAIHYLFMSYSTNSSQSRSITEMLIEKGVDVNHRNSSDFTPLHVALLNS